MAASVPGLKLRSSFSRAGTPVAAFLAAFLLAVALADPPSPALESRKNTRPSSLVGTSTPARASDRIRSCSGSSAGSGPATPSSSSPADALAALLSAYTDHSKTCRLDCSSRTTARTVLATRPPVPSASASDSSAALEVAWKTKARRYTAD